MYYRKAKKSKSDHPLFSNLLNDFIEPQSQKNEGNSEDENTLRQWKLCDKRFTRQGLGGHMSRAHPGESVDYK